MIDYSIAAKNAREVMDEVYILVGQYADFILDSDKWLDNLVCGSRQHKDLLPVTCALTDRVKVLEDALILIAKITPELSQEKERWQNIRMIKIAKQALEKL